MRKIPILVAMIVGVAMILPAQAQTVPAQAAACNLAQAAFCETFDVKGGGNVRNGDLPEWWGVSRVLGDGQNPGQGQVSAWADTDIVTCSGTQRVTAPRDVQVCNGQLREASNDDGTVSVLAMYPKQPFDWAGRTGRIAFDVTNDSIGMHTSWPELWVTDMPVPAPFTHLGSWESPSRYGFGLRFGAATGPGQGGNLGPNCPSDQNSRWTVDSVTVSRNYAVDDSTNDSRTPVQRTGCVIASSGPNGGFNHIEVTVSESRLEVYATDAGSTQIKQIAVVPNANLGFTRGLIWIEDAHYNAVKFGGTAMHTFTWDNVGFDGPVLARDVTFDEPDALTPSSGLRKSLGYLVRAGQQRTMNLPAFNRTANAKAAYLLTNYYSWSPVSQVRYSVNGNAHTAAVSFPNNVAYTERSVAFPIPVGELHDGANTITFGADVEIIQANGGVVLAGADDGNGAPPVATATPSPTTAATATATLVPSSTATAVPSATSTPIPSATATPTTGTRACYVQAGTDGQTFAPTLIRDQTLAAAICGTS